MHRIVELYRWRHRFGIDLVLTRCSRCVTSSIPVNHIKYYQFNNRFVILCDVYVVRKNTISCFVRMESRTERAYGRAACDWLVTEPTSLVDRRQWRAFRCTPRLTACCQHTNIVRTIRKQTNIFVPCLGRTGVAFKLLNDLDIVLFI